MRKFSLYHLGRWGKILCYKSLQMTEQRVHVTRLNTQLSVLRENKRSVFYSQSRAAGSDWEKSRDRCEYLSVKKKSRTRPITETFNDGIPQIYFFLSITHNTECPSAIVRRFPLRQSYVCVPERFDKRQFPEKHFRQI